MKSKISPFLWSGCLMALALVLTLSITVREKRLFEESNIVSPHLHLWEIVAYFFGVVVIMGLVLFLIPLKRLGFIFRIMFALMFGWGVFIFIFVALKLPPAAAYPVAVIAGVAWLFWKRIWLHNLLLLITLSAAGSVFGFLFSPWTFMVFMLVIAVYDIVAVRFGFMVWMADKLSESTTLPAFVLPRQLRYWKSTMQNVSVGELKEKESDKREYAILGGGDIGFPLMLAVSVFYDIHLTGAILVGAFALIGLMSAFLIQMLWLKGKPMPALPPIAFFSLIGFLISFLCLN